MVDFYDSSDLHSIDDKMNVLRMIDRVNANSKVGIVRIRLDSDYKWNSEILTLIANKYTNIYAISVWDYND